MRQASLSGIANRYVDLRLGAGNAPKIASGGVIPTTATTSAVDIDQLFNTLNPPTLKGLQNLIQGTASEFANKGAAAQAAWQYLNPAVASSSTLFSELNRHDGGDFTSFVVKSGKLLSDIAVKQADLSALVKNLGSTTQALASQKTALGQSIQRLPGFMALADTTFVNLRNSLDALTPLVNASKPVAPKLQKFLVQLRPLAHNAVPTVRDLANLICSRGSKPCSPSTPGQNDLLQLLELSVPLAGAACGDTGDTSNCNGTLQANGQQRLGAFPQSTAALNQSTPELATARPYAVDLTGWFEGFSHPGWHRRERQLQPGRPGDRGWLDLERSPEPPAVVPGSGAAHGARVRRQRHAPGRDQHAQPGPLDLGPGGSVPRLDGARRGVLPRGGLPV